MTEATKQIISLHTRYESLSGRCVPLTDDKIAAWQGWVALGYTERDLESVIRYLLAQVKTGKAFVQQLWFRNLIAQPDKFQEHLNDARTIRTIKTEATKGRPLAYPPYSIESMTRVKYHCDLMRKAAG